MNFVTLTWPAHHPLQVCFVLQSTHWIFAKKIQKEHPTAPADRREGGAAQLLSPQMCLQLAIWKDNSSLTSEMHLLARLLRNIECYFINPEINFNLADVNEVRRAAESFQALMAFPFMGREGNNRLHLPAQQCQNTLLLFCEQRRSQ